MTEFKKGDKVKCILGVKGKFAKGGVYTVSKPWPPEGDPSFIQVEEFSGGWLKSRFELIKTLKEGDIFKNTLARDMNGMGLPDGSVILCVVDTDDVYGVGKEYILKSNEIHCGRNYYSGDSQSAWKVISVGPKEEKVSDEIDEYLWVFVDGSTRFETGLPNSETSEEIDRVVKLGKDLIREETTTITWKEV
jgi:hypothetical protein